MTTTLVIFLIIAAVWTIAADRAEYARDNASHKGEL